MTTSPAPRAETRVPPARAFLLTTVAGLVGGCALVADTVTIVVINGSFGLLDDVLFWIGLVGLLVTLVAVAVTVSAPRTGLRRVGSGVATFVAVFVAIAGLAQLLDTMGHHVFSPANQGLHGEWSFFTVGVCLLLIAGWANRARADRWARSPSGS